MPRLRLAALGVLLVAAGCDATPADPAPFSLTVAVRTPDGRAATGGEVFLVFEPAAPTESPRTAAGPQGFLSPIGPTPWSTVARVFLYLPADADVQVALLDLDGRLAQRVAEPQRLASGNNAFTLHDSTDALPDLPGGVYAVQAVVGADTLAQWTVHTDVGADRSRVLVRRLGRPGTDGRLTLSDRTAVPAFHDLPPLPYIDGQGTALGAFRYDEDAQIVHRAEDGTETRASARLQDGPNTVTIQL